MEDQNITNIIDFILKAESIISTYPKLLEDELYPDIKKAYREHYRRKHINVPRKTHYEEEVERLEGERDYLWEKANEPCWYSYYSSYNDELDAVGGEISALSNIY